MKPSNETIEKFKRIYFEEFGEEISKEEAYEKFRRLVNLLRVILRPSDSSSLKVDQTYQDDKLNHY